MLLETWFPDTLFGMPGDEDGGGMSAFVVFSMLGFYPVSPGVPVYEVGSPVFDRAAIRLHDGRTLQIIARDNSRDNKYIQSLKLNGKPLPQVWFRHADIVNGGTLELQMSNIPNKELGALPASFPPSRMNLDPQMSSPERFSGIGRCGTRPKRSASMTRSTTSTHPAAAAQTTGAQTYRGRLRS